MPSIQLLTEIPGPRSREILARKQSAVAAAMTVQAPLIADSALGAVVTDVDGNRLLDLTGGIGCLAVGHAHPHVVEAVQKQAARFLHTDFAIVPYEIYITVAERLVAVAPFSGPARAVFFNSGAEAVENAVKIARQATKRPAVIAFEGGFHGRTLLALTMTSKANPYKVGLGPLAPAVYHLPFAQDYRGPSGAEALAALERALVTQVAPSEVAAIVVEPIQGEGGYVVPPDGFLRKLREICDTHGILLVADEVQTGFGRTGRMFAVEHDGVVPDIMCVAKGLGNGLPIGAMVAKASVMSKWHSGEHGTTYGGNAVACAAAVAVIETLRSERLPERAAALGERILERARGWRADHPRLGDVRGRGFMIGLEFMEDGRPAPELVQRIIRAAVDRNLLLLSCGLDENVIRLIPPLTLTEEELTQGLDILEASLEAAGA
jgi:4-aminobutyrate aminotransferase/(S)-3-amino-2-methylpropionate transaminase